MPLIENLEQLKQLKLAQVPARLPSPGILMCTPYDFDVIDVKNPYMEGQIGKVDRQKAVLQWKRLYQAYAQLGLKIHTVSSMGLEDMVFVANAALCWQEPGKTKRCLLSRMLHPSRQRETMYIHGWFVRHSYFFSHLAESKDVIFEGGGDGIWQPNKMLLWGGYGFRSTRRAYEGLNFYSAITTVPLRLIDKDFYHLDTCFCILDEQTVLFCPAAFEPEGVAMIRHFFHRKIELGKEECVRYMSGNCFSVNGKWIVLQAGNQQLVKRLSDAGYWPIEVDLSEFMKSGGNATCLKLDI